MKAQARIAIARPPAEVFAVMTDVPRQPEWSKGAGRISNLSDDPVKLGSTWIQTSKALGREASANVKVHEYEPSRRYGLEMDKPFPGRIEWTFEPDGNGTLVTQSAEFEPGAFFALATPLLRKGIQDMFDTDLASLRRRVEGGAGS
jgi:uncharacterized protein YndB with AHSA1/START domain